MKRISILVMSVLFCSFLLSAQDKMQNQEKKEVKETKGTAEAKAASPSWTGYLVDKMCGARYVKGEASAAAEKGMKHSKSCALDEDCAASGFGIIMDGKYVKFDEAGDKIAADYLNKSDKKTNFLVDVTGSKDGDMLKVKTLADAKMEMKKDGKEAPKPAATPLAKADGKAESGKSYYEEISGRVREAIGLGPDDVKAVTVFFPKLKGPGDEASAVFV